MQRRLLSALLALTAALAVVMLPGDQRATAASPSDLLLPDLQQDVPRVLEVEPDDAGGWKLGFRSAVRNAGPGPMIIHGHRPDTATPEMTADQVIARADGSTTLNPGIGRMEFVVSATHRHWHLLGFEVYELRRGSDYELVSPSSKTGFCLQDSSTYPDETLPTRPSEPYYQDECALEHPEALEVNEGISVGWIDVYSPFREGQDVALSGLPAGQYQLVHRTNVDGRIRELDRLNDAATLLVELSWPDGQNGKPAVETLRSCAASRRCYLTPPALVPGQLARFADVALGHAFRRRAWNQETTCAEPAGIRGVCSASVGVGRRTWHGSVAIRSILVDGVPYFRWSTRLRHKRLGCVKRCKPVTRRDSGRQRVPGA